MGTTIDLSKRSQELIKQYIDLGCSKGSSLHDFSSSVDSDLLVQWLDCEVSTPENASNKSKKESEFILASLRAELLRDLLVFMQEGKAANELEEKQVSTAAKLKFFMLAASGTILAACEGFDSITTLMGVFSLPSVVTLLAGLVFSTLSVLVFYGFDLVQVSKNLGVKIVDAPKILDRYLLQMEEIKAIRKKINGYNLAGLSTDELARINSIIIMLQKRLESLKQASEQFNSALNSPKMKIAKNIFVGVAGLLFFGGGFFTGQSVAIFLLGLGIAGVTATFWPVVLFSIAVGLAAFALYWYVERVGLQQLISGLFGLDEDKIEQLCDSKKLEKQAEKLENLKEKVAGATVLVRRVEALEQQLSVSEGRLKDDPQNTSSTRLKITIPEPTSVSKISTNIHSFHRAEKSKVDLSSESPPDSLIAKKEGLLCL